MPVISASPGTMLWRVPAWNVPTVSTAGCVVTSSWRLGMVWKPSTICEPMTIGSMPAHGMRAVRLLAGDLQVEGVGGRQDRAGAGSRCRRCSAPVMTCRPKITSGFGIGEGAFGEHPPGAAGLAARHALLGRLEDAASPCRGSSSCIAGEHLGGAHQDRGVGVVAAGVHHADLLAVPLGAGLRGEGQVDLLRRPAARPCRRAAPPPAPGRPPSQHADDAGDADALASPRSRAPAGARRPAPRCGSPGCRAPGSGGCRGASR